MSRRTTTAWAVGAVVIVGAGIAVAAAAMASPRADDVSAGSTPTASATSESTPRSTASSGSTASATPAPGTGSGTGTGTGTGSGSAGSPSAPAAPSPGSSSSSPAASPARNAVTPLITFYDGSAGSLSVGAHVAGLVEDGGTCTLTARKGSTTVTDTFPASAQASSTECGTMTLASPRLTAGSWSVSVSYSSTRSVGTSAAAAVAL